MTVLGMNVALIFNLQILRAYNWVLNVFNGKDFVNIMHAYKMSGNQQLHNGILIFNFTEEKSVNIHYTHESIMKNFNEQTENIFCWHKQTVYFCKISKIYNQLNMKLIAK